jgi:hypothetical protein
MTGVNLDLTYEKVPVRLLGHRTLFLPSIPDILILGKPGSVPTEFSLRFPNECIYIAGDSTFYLKLELLANEAKATISDAPIPQISPPRMALSLFLGDLKLFVFDDFTEPQNPVHFATLSMVPIAVDYSTVPGGRSSFAVSLGSFDLRFLRHFDKFPFLVTGVHRRSHNRGPILSLSGALFTNFHHRISIESLKIDVRAIQIQVEEAHLRFLMTIVAFLGSSSSPSVSQPPQTPSRVAPVFIGSLDIAATEIVLSAALRSSVHAEVGNVPFELSQIVLAPGETLPSALIARIGEQYVSDVLAAVPSLVTSLSLLGSPSHIVRHSMDSIEAFWDAPFAPGDSVPVGLGRGSVNVLRGIATGALESFVTLTNSLERTIRNLTSETGDAPRGRNQEGLLSVMSAAGQGVLGLLAIPTTMILAAFSTGGEWVLRRVGQNPGQGEEHGTAEFEEQALLRFAFDSDAEDE